MASSYLVAHSYSKSREFLGDFEILLCDEIMIFELIIKFLQCVFSIPPIFSFPSLKFKFLLQLEIKKMLYHSIKG